MNAALIVISKFLSLVLRHKPDEIGLSLDPNGWADVEELIRLSRLRGKNLSRSMIEDVVAGSDKQRFVLSPDGRRIRANQGHSLPVDLGLTPQTPPEILFHGTATRFADSIRHQGLVKGTRQQVHLSQDEATATQVGRRHGRPLVLKIQAGALFREGHIFWLSENGVWLTDHVPPAFIEFE